MEKKKITNLELNLYYHELKNGMKVYIIPRKKSNNIYVSYTTKYGSNYNEFIFNNETVKPPEGVAHFLEHKMFEQEDKSNPFNDFDKNGASGNAFTDYMETSYIFSGPTNFEKNMKILLNYIEHPYFTDKNVEKEKGIIIQELKMYDDSSFDQGIKYIFQNAFVNHPIRIDICGTIESINSITKEDLYKCYNAFYNPKNMFMIVTGNIEARKVIKILEENTIENKTKFDVVLKKHDEPDTVFKNEETLYMNVTIDKVYYGIKINMDRTNISYKKTKQYISLFLDSIIGSTSILCEKLKEKEIINENLSYFMETAGNHLIVVVEGETKLKQELVLKIKKELINIPDEETFNRKKKVFLSQVINSVDNIFKLNTIVRNSIINENEFNPNFYEDIKSLNYTEFLKVVKSISFDNDLVVYIEPK